MLITDTRDFIFETSGPGSLPGSEPLAWYAVSGDRSAVTFLHLGNYSAEDDFQTRILNAENTPQGEWEAFNAAIQPHTGAVINFTSVLISPVRGFSLGVTTVDGRRIVNLQQIAVRSFEYFALQDSGYYYRRYSNRLTVTARAGAVNMSARDRRPLHCFRVVAPLTRAVDRPCILRLLRIAFSTDMDRQRFVRVLRVAIAASAGGIIERFAVAVAFNISHATGPPPSLWIIILLLLIGVGGGSIAGAAVASRSELPRRFSLRTLLIATTLVAVVLGLAVALW